MEMVNVNLSREQIATIASALIQDCRELEKISTDDEDFRNLCVRKYKEKKLIVEILSKCLR